MLVVAVLIIFVLVGLSLPPLFSFLNTGIATAQNTGRHTREIYAAEAGAYDGVWKVTRLEPGSGTRRCSIPSPAGSTACRWT